MTGISKETLLLYWKCSKNAEVIEDREPLYHQLILSIIEGSEDKFYE